MGEEFQRSVEEFVAKLNRVLDLSINAACRFDAALSRTGAAAELEVRADADVQSVGVAAIATQRAPRHPSESSPRPVHRQHSACEDGLGEYSDSS